MTKSPNIDVAMCSLVCQTVVVRLLIVLSLAVFCNVSSISNASYLLNSVRACTMYANIHLTTASTDALVTDSKDFLRAYTLSLNFYKSDKKTRAVRTHEAYHYSACE